MLSNFLIDLCGALAIILIGFGIGPFLKYVVPSNYEKYSVSLNRDDWKSFVDVYPISRTGFFLGRIESLIVYVSFLKFENNVPYVIGGLLAFKVASKWETSNNIHKVPIVFNGIKKNDFFKVRLIWGNIIYARFIFGTLSNILIGFFAYLFVIFLKNKEGKVFIDWFVNNWVTIVFTLIGVLVSIFTTKHYYQKSIDKYKSVINKDLLERTKSNWGHFNEINNIAANLPSANGKDLIIKHSANGLTDAGYIDGVIKKLLD